MAELLLVLKKLTTEKYARSHPELLLLDEYVRNLYIKMLCTVVQYDNIPEESQQCYLERIVRGFGADGTLEEYMRQALELSETDVREFFSYMKGSRVSYYFVLDSLILTGMSSVSEKNREYLAQLTELCGITKKELQQLCIVAKSIITQQPALFDAARTLRTSKVSSLDFAPYVRDYYTGAIIDTEKEKYYSAPDKEQSEEIAFPDHFKSLEKVAFHNLKIERKMDLIFEGCAEVCFKNCDITGPDCTIRLLSCGTIVFENCRFFNFNKVVLYEKENRAVTIKNCSFTDCMDHYFRSSDDWKERGCVIYTAEPWKNGINEIINCIFKNCGGINSKFYYSSAFISNARCRVTDCSFFHCWHYNNTDIPRNDKKDPEAQMRTMFRPNTQGGNNQILDSASFCTTEK